MIEFINAECITWMNAQPADRFDLVFGSPPYVDCRTYGVGAQRECVEWVEWMLAVTGAAARICRGPVVWVAAGATRKRNYWPACEGLMWEWWKRGGTHELYRPCVFHRVGIPGSGGKDWFRADWEYVMCFKRPGALAWSDNTACGHPPKWSPGGEMSYRMQDGRRVDRTHTKRKPDGAMETQGYAAPVLANPGNVFHLKVGGGQMGSQLAHENEAPFPEALAEIFIRSLCPPGGIVLDPFSGSGTTCAVAERWGRNAVGVDLRQSQVELGRRRCQVSQGRMFDGQEASGEEGSVLQGGVQEVGVSGLPPEPTA